MQSPTFPLWAAPQGINPSQEAAVGVGSGEEKCEQFITPTHVITRGLGGAGARPEPQAMGTHVRSPHVQWGAVLVLFQQLLAASEQ